jgi:hypothetical protein
MTTRHTRHGTHAACVVAAASRAVAGRGNWDAAIGVGACSTRNGNTKQMLSWQEDAYIPRRRRSRSAAALCDAPRAMRAPRC